MGLTPAAARRLADAPWADLFDALAPHLDRDLALRFARVLEKRVPYYARRAGVDLEQDDSALAAVGLTTERLEPVVRGVSAGEMLPRALELALDDLAAAPSDPVAGVRERYRVRADDAERLDELVMAVSGRVDALDGRPRDVILRWAMGEVMRDLWGRVEASEVRRRLAESLFREETEVSA
jgi:Asp-tRNA(Asn)/Glu-tRNA(Gln) amidotransferase B subunit